MNVLETLATHITTNIRELEGALDKPAGPVNIEPAGNKQ
jgi:chromosomal replication initiation ATPase DnaA